MMYPKLNPISGQCLLEKHIEPTPAIVENFIFPGATLFVGAPKSGKSWTMLGLSVAVCAGESFLRLKTAQGGVLYLSLEDTESRAQKRLQMLCDEIEGFELQREIRPIGNGFSEQLSEYLSDNSATKLVIVDTLQKVRIPSSQNIYAADYADMGVLKTIADTYKVAIVAVHHTRKSTDQNVFNMVSGSNGLMGCADETIVLTPDPAGNGVYKFDVTGRDVEAMQIRASFKDGAWTAIERIGHDELNLRTVPDVVKKTLELIQTSSDGFWEGTATEILSALEIDDMKPHVLSKKLNEHREFLASNGVKFSCERTSSARILRISRIPTPDANDANDAEGHT